MKTDHLINALVADLTVSKIRFGQRLLGAVALGSIVAAIVFFVSMGPRPDILQALDSVRFLSKLTLALYLAVTATGLLLRLARPGAAGGPWAVALLAAPVLLLVGVGSELLTTPSSSWWPRLVGSNAVLCLTFIPLLSVAPLICLFFALQRGAPTNPGIAGAVAGFAASGVGALLYASHCPDDSPLFVAAWYTIAAGVVALCGYAAGSRWLRW